MKGKKFSRLFLLFMSAVYIELEYVHIRSSIFSVPRLST